MESTADKPRVTVITPTYNRADTLSRVHESLLAQTMSDFEWVVVDDGSHDGTKELVASWRRAAAIAIVYVDKENEGKHLAINTGLKTARGTFTTIIDSDDVFVPDALETLLHHWSTIPVDRRDEFSGVVGLCAYDDGRIVGDSFPQDPLDCDPVELTYVYRVTGDKHSLLRTAVLRQYPFPEAPRAYVPEGLVWNRMALKYLERHVNVVVKVVNYREGGLSDRSLELQVGSPHAVRQFYMEELQLPHRLSRRTRLRSYANYVRFSLHARVGLLEQARSVPSKVAWTLLAPLGAGLYFRDRRRVTARPTARSGL